MQAACMVDYGGCVKKVSRRPLRFCSRGASRREDTRPGPSNPPESCRGDLKPGPRESGQFQPACLTTRRSKHAIRPPGLRCACLACSTYCSSTPARAKRLAPFSSARLAPSPDGPLTHFASPCGEKGRLAGSNDVAPRDAVEANVINITFDSERPTAGSSLPFSPPDGRSTRYDCQDFVALACRARRTVQVRLRAPSGSRLFSPPGLRLVLTALSRTSPRHVVRNAG